MAYQMAFQNSGRDVTIYDHDGWDGVNWFSLQVETNHGSQSIRLTLDELRQLRDAIDITLRPHDQKEDS